MKNVRHLGRSKKSVLAGLALFFPIVSLAAVQTNVFVGSHIVTGPVPLDYTDPLTGSRATVQTSATATCFGLACAAPGPAVGAYGRSSIAVQTILDYGFSVLGPAPAAVPLMISGNYSNINPLVAGGVTESVAQASFRQGATSASFTSNCYDFANPQNQELPASQNCGAGSYRLNFIAASGTSVFAELSAFIQPFGTDPNGATVSLFMDPYVQIEPNWLSTHAGYSLLFDAGVANIAAVTPVPEPETIALLALGLGAIGARRRLVR